MKSTCKGHREDHVPVDFVRWFGGLGGLEWYVTMDKSQNGFWLLPGCVAKA